MAIRSGQDRRREAKTTNDKTQPALCVAFDEFDRRERERVLARLRVLRAWAVYQTALLDDVGAQLRDGTITPTDAQDWISDCYQPPESRVAA